jgi:hypothetical protein
MESNPIFNPKTGTRTAPSLAESEFREVLARILKLCPKDRQAVAVELSALTGERITRGMLNDWLAPSKPKVRFPACFIKTLCAVTGSDAAARIVLPDDLAATLSIGESVLQSLGILRRSLAELEKLAKGRTQKKLQRRLKR